MIVQGSIDFYEVGGEIDSSVDFSRLIFAISIGELPNVYANGQILLLSFDFAPLEAWKLYKAVANQSVVFNAAEWMEDKLNPYVKAIEAADRDGALAEALADGTITITPSSTAPLNPQLYDIWQCPAADVNIGDLSASDAEIMQKNGDNDVYFYWGTDSQWHLTTMPMESSIQDSKSTAVVKSQASVWNKVNVGGVPYINGWQSIIEYENNHLLKNDFAIIADNFYIGAVGNVVQNGIDSAGNPIYESTGEAYKPFTVDTVNHEITFNGKVSFTNTTGTLDTSRIINSAGWVTNSNLTSFIDNVYTADLANIQSQIDGQITTWFYDVAPTLVNVPASTWTTTVLKDTHLGDVYYDNVTGYAYRFKVSTGVYSWLRITDSDITLALSKASTAQDTADGKRRVFIATPTVPYDIGDLWSGGSTGDLKRCQTAKTSLQSYSAADWVLATKYTDDTVATAAQATANTANTNASTALTALSDIASDALLTPSEKQLLLKEIAIIIAEKALIDSQADVFSITTEKTNYGVAYSMMNIIGYVNGGNTNSLFDLYNTVPLLSSLTTTSTITMNLTVAGETLLTGAAAFRRVFSFFYTTRQTLLNAIATKAKTIADSKLSSASDLAALVNAGTTTIDGGKITATSLLINNINALGGIIANYLQAGVASIGNTISSSDFLSIGGTGFRLKSNAAGTSADPTIYGAYIRGGTIDGAKFSLASTEIYNNSNPYNTGRFFLSDSTIINDGVISFVGLSYSSGYIANRCIADTQRFAISCSANFIGSGSGNRTGTLTVYASINGGAYSSIGSNSVTWYTAYGIGAILLFPVSYSISNIAFSTISFKVTASGGDGIATTSMDIITTNSI